MDERKLQTFLTAVHTGSFNKTASVMNFSQSAVSQMMNAMESELGCKLLERNHSGIRLTSAGKELLPFIEQAEHALVQLQKHARNIADGEQAPIRIGTFSSISNTWLPSILSSYKKVHPETLFEIRIGFHEISGWLSEGDIDLALGDKERCCSAHWKPIFQEPYFGVVPDDFPSQSGDVVSQTTLSEYPLIIRPASVLHGCLNAVFSKQVYVSGDDDHTLLAMVAQGLGVSIMPQSCLPESPKQVKLLNLEPPLDRTIGIALTDTPRKSVVSFYQYLREQFKKGI